MHTTHAILLGGTVKDYQGRPLGPYRLRSACASAGFNLHVIDYAWGITADELLTIINKLASDDTLVLGISNVWFTTDFHKHNKSINPWFTPEFFAELKNRWPRIQVVIGGTKPSLVQGAELIKPYAKWWLTGFADIGFVELLRYLRGDGNKFIFKLDRDNLRITDCNVFYKVENMDDLETVFVKEDNFLQHQPLPLEVSRGCIFQCSFCSHPFLGKKSYEYIRSAQSIANELRRNYELFGTTRYIITDDTFNDSMEKLDRMEQAVELSRIPNFEFTCYIRAELLATTPQMIPSLKRLGIRGGTVGLESFGKQARQAIGKGMDIERVLDALAKFKSESRVLLQTGMIVGLPGDTADDCFRYAERLENDQILSDWIFQPLGMVHDDDKNGLSIFEKNPEKYGYEITKWNVDSGEGNTWTCSWKSAAGLTSRTATDIASEINEHGKTVCKPGGFAVSSLWYHGFDDNSLDTMLRYSPDVFKVINKNSTIRKIREVSKFKQ